MPSSNGSDFASDLFESDGETSELWRRSASPRESFSDAEGADEDGSWAVQIIGEEVIGEEVIKGQEADGRPIIRHEARWETWTRADGTNTTWDDELLHPDDLSNWRRLQTCRRKGLAEESLDIEIWGTLDIHNTATRSRAQAYQEKRQRRKENPLNHRETMAMLLGDKLPRACGDPRAATSPTTSGASLRPRRQATDSSSVHSAQGSVASSSRSSVSFSSMNNSTRTSSATSVSVSASAPVVKPRGRPRKYQLRSPSPAENTATSPRPIKKLPARAQKAAIPKVSRCEALQREWTKAAKFSRAASISIVNDVDDEEIPHLEPGFQYLEAGYKYSEDIPPPDDAERFVFCDCEECGFASACDCQEPSELVDEDGERMIAYTEKGLFAFNVPPGIEVIECNRFCRCTFKSCPNRVAQLPRKVPVEIFKTENCGWGVRSSKNIERGKVLGIYTGLLIPRSVAAAFSGDEGSYCFDLDGREILDAETPDEAYSVDSRHCGNWTRFINHSCDPNLRVYLVVFDSIPERYTPYLAFVALEDILAGTEFTFDYDPGVNTRVKGKGKGKVKIPPGAKPCKCGTAICRGWVRV